jgi:hypothetical protein
MLDAEAATPVPESVTVCGELPAESVMLRMAAREPAALGLKVMLTVQEAEAASADPQVEPVMVKSA